MSLKSALAFFFILSASNFANAVYNVTCTSEDGLSKVTLSKLSSRYFIVSIAVGNKHSEPKPLRIFGKAHAFGENDGHVILDPAPGGNGTPWLLKLDNLVSRTAMSLRFADSTEMGECAEALEHRPDKFLYCDINDVNELIK